MKSACGGGVGRHEGKSIFFCFTCSWLFIPSFFIESSLDAIFLVCRRIFCVMWFLIPCLLFCLKMLWEKAFTWVGIKHMYNSVYYLSHHWIMRKNNIFVKRRGCYGHLRNPSFNLAMSMLMTKRKSLNWDEDVIPTALH